jgi:predicted membrane channel-forming protein YqfA (hemolysin III family)
MPRISVAFLTVAALCGLTGMVWGSVMGSHQDFTTAPAHAHLNLLGWVSLAIMGLFYALPGAQGRRLAWLNLVLSAAGAIVFAACLAFYLLGRTQFLPGVFVGASLAILGMLCFLINILRSARRSVA